MYFYTIFVIFLWTAAGSCAADAASPPQSRVGQIRIDSQNVFDPKAPGESRRVFQWANAIHFTTQESVIRKELLLKEGDPLDPALLAETERNLRRFRFLRRVRIEQVPAADGVVDLVIHTQDAWSLEPRADLRRVGGKNLYKFGVVERNILGLGKGAGAVYDPGDGGAVNRTLAYTDPHFLRHHIELNGTFIDFPEGRHYGLSLARPFYATTASYSLGASAQVIEQRQPRYLDGANVGDFKAFRRDASAFYGRSLIARPSKTLQTTVALRRRSAEFFAVASKPGFDLPRRENSTAIEWGGALQLIRFVRERHIEKFDRDEDYNIGPSVSMALGVAPTWLDSTKGHALPKLGASAGRSWGPGNFALLRTDFGAALFGDETRNSLWSTDLTYYKRWVWSQTLAAHAGYGLGHRLDPDRVLSLGEDNGLRGYSIGQFSGNRRVLFNLENRMFLADDLFHLVSLGLVPFLDSGYVWSEGKGPSWSRMRSSAGLGFRVAFSRSSRNEPLRIDVAYALNDNQQRSRLAVSIQAGRTFGAP